MRPLFGASVSLVLILGPAGTSAGASLRHDEAAVVGGRGDWTFRYLPDRLTLPAGSCASDGCNCHGLVVDKSGNIYLTYEPDRAAPDDVRCMVRFEPDGTGGRSYGSPELCSGTPHGLTLVEEDGHEYLYHANNAAAIFKTELDGTVVWSNTDRPPEYTPDMPYKPTWVAAPPYSPYVYVADGYGSQFVHILDKSDGKFAGITFGGRGTDPGTFQTCHGMNVDSRREGDEPLIIVSDRENHRHQYFRYDPQASAGEAGEFEYDSEFTVPGLNRVCHFRETPDGSSHAVIPALEGPVAIVNGENDLVSIIDVASLIGHLGHLHPHDAIILPSGGMVVVTWNPGRVSYWKRVVAPVDESAGISLA